MKAGFIGAGGIANAHFQQVQKIKGVEMAAFCDIDEARVQAAKATYGGTAYTNYEEMLENEPLDMCWICLPPHLHGRPEMLCVEKDVAIFVEKPISNRVETILTIAEAIDSSGVINSVGYHFRYTSGTNRAKELLVGQTVGMVCGYWMGGFPGVFWWRRMDESGGQMNEQTTHIIDLARYLIGEVTEVYAAYGLRVLGNTPNITVPDVGSVTIKFANGIVGQISNTCMLNLHYKVGLDVFTADAVFEIDAGDLKVIRADGVESFTSEVNPTMEEDKIFVDAVRTRNSKNIRSSYADALKTLKVTLAANKSAETGLPVTVE